MKITLRNCLVTDKIHDLTLEKNKIEDLALLEGREPNDSEKLSIDEIEKKIAYMNSHSDRTYTAPFIEFGMYKDFFELKESMGTIEDEAEAMAKFVTFVCNIFGNQFTEEQFCRGIAIHKINETIMGVFGDTEKMINDGVEIDTQY